MQISIIIPAYNASNFIVDAVLSVLDQEFNEWELIIVDDNSDDDTQKIIKNLFTGDTRIKLISGEGAGVSKARVLGSQFAQGEYFLFMDADDTLPYDALKALAETADHTNADIIIGDIIHNDCGVRKNALYGHREFCSGLEHFDWIVDNLTGFLWGKLLKRELFLSIPVQPVGVRFCEDFLQMLQLSAMAKRVAHCGVPTYEYYQHPESACNKLLTRQEFGRRFFVLIDNLQKLIEADCFNDSQQSRLKAMFLYYGRLYLLVNGKWGDENKDIKHNFSTYLKLPEIKNDILLKGHHRLFMTKLVYIFPKLFSIPYILLLRYKYHRIK